MYDGKISSADPNLVESFDLPGDLRAFVVYDRNAESNFGLEHVFGYHALVEHGPRGWRADHLVGSGAMPEGLTEALDRWSFTRDRVKIERYLRIFHDCAEIAFVEAGPDGGMYVASTTHAELARLCMDLTPNVEQYLIDDLTTYGEWARGDVYGVIVNDPATGTEASLWGCFDSGHDFPYLREVAGDLAAELEAARGAAKDADDFGDLCDECGAAIDTDAAHLVNGAHAATCSLHPANTVGVTHPSHVN